MSPPPPVRKIFGGADGARSSNNTEAIIYEYEENFDDASAAIIAARLSAILNRGAVAGTGTYRLYTGATGPGSTAGATQRAIITTVSATDEDGPTTTDIGTAFPNPGGIQLVQVTAQHSVVGGTANIRGMDYAIG